jgi:hypothetical protein
LRVAALPISVPLLVTNAFVYYRPTFIQEMGVKSTQETFLATGPI